MLVAEITNGKRDSFIKEMASEYGIQCVVQYYPLNRYDLYKKLRYGEASCPNADNFYDNMVSFPFHSSLSNEELNMVKESSLRVLESLA